jgi:hypothetical protein
VCDRGSLVALWLGSISGLFVAIIVFVTGFYFA